LPDPPDALAGEIRKAIQLQPGEGLFGVVDGAQDLALAFEAKCQYGWEIVNLFEGPMANAAASVAPYIVPIHSDSGYLQNWARHWGRNAGILLTTAAAPEPLRAHLRRIFIAQDEQNQQYFFRYYDPRVLCTYLPTCTASELAVFFGPIRSLLAEDPTGESLLCFSRGSAGLITNKIGPDQWRGA